VDSAVGLDDKSTERKAALRQKGRGRGRMRIVLERRCDVRQVKEMCRRRFEAHG
jgi:hypothetical protein